MGLIRTILKLSFFAVVCCEYVSFDELYEAGIVSYGNEDWEGTIHSLEKSIESYRYYRSSVVSCYQKCKNAASNNEIVDKSGLGKIAAKALCSNECFDEKFDGLRHVLRVSPEVKQAFVDLLPYKYLQFAYFKEGLLEKSVSAAYTFNRRFPEDKMMKGNMEYFRSNDDVSENMFINLEPTPHLEKFDAAVQAYLREDYGSAAKHFEEALIEYYESVEECHALCEIEDDSRESDDVYRQNADHYILVLECNLKCIRNLPSEVDGKTFPNYVPLQYHYLQFAYYQINELDKAVECAKTYMLFYENDTIMQENLQLFMKDGAEIDRLEPRKDAERHYKRITLEASLLKYAYQAFGVRDFDRTLIKPFQTTDESEQTEEVKEDAEATVETQTPASDPPYESMKEKTDDILSRKDIAVELKFAEAEKAARDEAHYMEPEDDVDISGISLSKIGRQTIDSKYIVAIDDAEETPVPEGPILFKGATLVANSTQLKGRERFAVDGLASESECHELIDLELKFGKPGDGYNGKSSPHTEHEKFEGVTLLRAAMMAKEGRLPLSSALLYYELSEKSRAQVQAYFKLPNLYFDYTHLVCRTTVQDSPSDRIDLSHPVHADNCLLKSTGECIKEPPAYTWRDYSAILYLNDDFIGGEFLFADSTARRVRTLVKPRCGRMVSFTAGPESFHGVKPVISGRRCAVALWFTLSKARDELNRIEAKMILDELVLRQKDEL